MAALTVGLGFGLQEIFANFVSGLILLFERPIRVGDIVTVDGTTGVVSRIQTRATTVTNWDRQDLIVPNKEFITGRLLNWTRSDHVNRIVINVGIAYGSDTELARRLIEEVLREHSEVLGDPPSIVTFEGFGESTLNLVAPATWRNSTTACGRSTTCTRGSTRPSARPGSRSPFRSAASISAPRTGPGRRGPGMPRRPREPLRELRGGNRRAAETAPLQRASDCAAAAAGRLR